MESAADDADDRSELLPRRLLEVGAARDFPAAGVLVLKNPSNAVVEDDDGRWPRLAKVGLFLRNSSDRLRMSKREEIEDWEI
jgi:hypothetical protein